jgi:hypothetical protein
MNNKELIKWLRDNSSGGYRPSEIGADRLEIALYLLKEVMSQVPSNRDWLNPITEKTIKDLLESRC